MEHRFPERDTETPAFVAAEPPDPRHMLPADAAFLAATTCALEDFVWPDDVQAAYDEGIWSHSTFGDFDMPPYKRDRAPERHSGAASEVLFGDWSLNLYNRHEQSVHIG